MTSYTVLSVILFLAVAATSVYAQNRIPGIITSKKDVNPPAFDDQVHCMIACQPGQFLDWKECKCIDIGDFTPHPPVSTTTTVAPPTTCQPIRCPLKQMLPCSVYQPDKNGCLTCRCKCYKVTSRQCPTDCKFGTMWTYGDNGCKICACAPRPKEKICPPVCAIFCPYGNVLDSDGCPTCSCNNADLQPW